MSASRALLSTAAAASAAGGAGAASSVNLGANSLRFKKLLIVIKQTAFEEYSQVRACSQLAVSVLDNKDTVNNTEARRQKLVC